jgi:hypothetical protein
VSRQVYLILLRLVGKGIGQASRLTWVAVDAGASPHRATPFW